MKPLRFLLITAIVLAVAVIPATLLIERHYGSKAQLVQIVRVTEEAQLFGDVGEMIGSPQLMIIEDQGAFVEGEGPSGSRLASEAYLREKGIYPMQLKTVQEAGWMTRIAAFVAIAFGAVALLFVNRRAKAKVAMQA